MTSHLRAQPPPQSATATCSPEHLDDGTVSVVRTRIDVPSGASAPPSVVHGLVPVTGMAPWQRCKGKAVDWREWYCLAPPSPIRPPPRPRGCQGPFGCSTHGPPAHSWIWGGNMFPRARCVPDSKRIRQGDPRERPKWALSMQNKRSGAPRRICSCRAMVSYHGPLIGPCTHLLRKYQSQKNIARWSPTLALSSTFQACPLKLGTNGTNGTNGTWMHFHVSKYVGKSSCMVDAPSYPFSLDPESLKLVVQSGFPP